MSISRRHPLYKEYLRNAILDTAEQLFIESGSYEAVSMRKIASEIGYSATTIYLYFENKEDLFQALLRETFRSLSRSVAMAVTQKDPVIALYQAMKSIILFSLEHPQHYRLLFHTQPALGHLPSDQRVDQEAFNLLRHQAQLCLRQRRIRDVEIEVLAHGAWSVVHGLISTLLDDPTIETESVIDHVLGSYMAGLMPDSPATV
ncbi:MAG: TetR/AcrR family transcriptional regulator [Chloroflexota bacterium]